METAIWIKDYLNRAEELIFDDRVNEGRALLESLLYEEPGCGPLHNMLGWTYMFYVNDSVNAEMHFRMAIHFEPELAPPYLHLGNLLSRKRRYDEAIEMFRSGLNKPEAMRVPLLEGIAMAHEVQGEFRQAMRIYKQAATASVVDIEVDRMLKNARRCRRKRMAGFLFF